MASYKFNIFGFCRSGSYSSIRDYLQSMFGQKSYSFILWPTSAIQKLCSSVQENSKLFACFLFNAEVVKSFAPLDNMTFSNQE